MNGRKLDEKNDREYQEAKSIAEKQNARSGGRLSAEARDGAQCGCGVKDLLDLPGTLTASNKEGKQL
jgi:hypothetical protein